MNTSSQPLEHAQSYGLLLLLVLMSVVSTGLAILATVRSVRSAERGWVLILWLLYIWLIPFIGPLVALRNFRRPVAA